VGTDGQRYDDGNCHLMLFANAAKQVKRNLEWDMHLEPDFLYII